MKKVILIGASVFMIVMISSCGGDDCYRCKRKSYYNGINYTDEGDWGIVCKKKGESDADFEERIEKKKSGYICEPK